jgi:hypothetical protein
VISDPPSPRLRRTSRRIGSYYSGITLVFHYSITADELGGGVMD